MMQSSDNAGPGGTIKTSLGAEMEAFDRLPTLVRRALAHSALPMSAKQALEFYRENGFDARYLAEAIRASDQINLEQNPPDYERPCT